jgi:hypothetical protein
MLEESKAIVRRLIEDHWNGKNLALVSEFFAPTVSLLTPDGRLSGLQGGLLPVASVLDGLSGFPNRDRRRRGGREQGGRTLDLQRDESGGTCPHSRNGQTSERAERYWDLPPWGWQGRGSALVEGSVRASAAARFAACELKRRLSIRQCMLVATQPHVRRAAGFQIARKCSRSGVWPSPRSAYSHPSFLSRRYAGSFATETRSTVTPSVNA